MEMESSESLSRMNFFPFIEAQWYQRRKEGDMCVFVWWAGAKWDREGINLPKSLVWWCCFICFILFNTPKYP